MKKVLIALAIGFAIGLAIWFFLKKVDTASSLRVNLGKIAGDIHITEGLTLDITLDLDNPTDGQITVQNIDMIGTFAGKSAGAVVPGTYSATIAPRSTTQLTVKYKIPMMDLLSIVGLSAIDLVATDGNILTKLKSLVKGKSFGFEGTVKALSLNVPFKGSVDVGNLIGV